MQEKKLITSDKTYKEDQKGLFEINNLQTIPEDISDNTGVSKKVKKLNILDFNK